MTLYGIRHNNEPILNNFKEKDISICGHNIPVTINDNNIYLTDSTNQSVEKTMEQLEHIINFLNKNSTIIYSKEHIITKSIETHEEPYKPRDNEYNGYMEALARGGEQWKTKFFVLRDNFLLYFKDNLSQKPEGIISLEYATVNISKDYEECFELACTTRRYHLRIKSNNELTIWMSKIKAAIEMTIDTNYELKEILGQGSFAKVERGIERTTGKNVAIKIINKDISAENRDSIMSEIIILKKLSHPHILKLHHVFETAQRIYLITDLLEGGELYDMIVERCNFTENESLRIIKKIVQTVEYMNTKHICHRDIKPENILFRVKGNIDSVCVTDFGLSKISTSKKLETACGTPSYVAPEVLSGEKYGFEVDIWSCGVLLYVLLCGFPPFYSDNDADLYKLIQSGVYSFPSPYWDNVSENAKDLIRKMLVVDPTKRLTSEQVLSHPFIINHRSLSFTRSLFVTRELSKHLVTQKMERKRVKSDSPAKTIRLVNVNNSEAI